MGSEISGSTVGSMVQAVLEAVLYQWGERLVGDLYLMLCYNDSVIEPG